MPAGALSHEGALTTDPMGLGSEVAHPEQSCGRSGGQLWEEAAGSGGSREQE